jgi:hypothetical protein
MLYFRSCIYANILIVHMKQKALTKKIQGHQYPQMPPLFKNKILVALPQFYPAELCVEQGTCCVVGMCVCVCEPSCACTRGCGLGVGIRYVFVCLRSSVLFCAWRLSVLVSVYIYVSVCVCMCSVPRCVSEGLARASKRLSIGTLLRRFCSQTACNNPQSAIIKQPTSK